jgi:two-component system NtrC family response regulator
MKPTLLIVDKDEELHAQAKWALAADFDIVVAEDRITALESFRRVRPLVILLNLGLFSQPNYPDEGLALLSEVVALDKLAKIIIVSRQMEKSIDLGAIGVGASGFLIKPIETAELKILVQNFFMWLIWSVSITKCSSYRTGMLSGV